MKREYFLFFKVKDVNGYLIFFFKFGNIFNFDRKWNIGEIKFVYVLNIFDDVLRIFCYWIEGSYY